MKGINYIDGIVFPRYKRVKARRDIPLQAILRPVADWGLSADIISITGFFCGVASAVFMQYSKLFFLIFWVLKRLTDVIDGPIARLNHKKLIPQMNMDHFSDLSFSLVLLAASIPFVGPYLPLIAIMSHILHIALDSKGIGESLFGPSNWAQFFFIFDLFQFGLLFQIAFNVIGIVGRGIVPKM